jgi:hypothetical protein
MKKPKRKEGQKMRGMYIDVPEDLYRQVKHFMVETDMKLKDIVGLALEEFLRSNEKGGGKK